MVFGFEKALMVANTIIIGMIITKQICMIAPNAAINGMHATMANVINEIYK